MLYLNYLLYLFWRGVLCHQERCLSAFFPTAPSTQWTAKLQLKTEPKCREVQTALVEAPPPCHLQFSGNRG